MKIKSLPTKAIKTGISKEAARLDKSHLIIKWLKLTQIGIKMIGPL